MCVNEFLERSIRRLLPVEFAERKKTFEDEMTDIAGGSNMEDGRVSVTFESHNLKIISIEYHDLMIISQDNLTT